MELNHFSDKQLEEELHKRKKEKLSLPNIQKEIDWTNLIDLMKSIIDDVKNGDWTDENDDNHYIADEVYKAVFGENQGIIEEKFEKYIDFINNIT